MLRLRLRLLLPRSKTLNSPITKPLTTTTTATSIDPSSSLTLHFLMNSCGLSPSAALPASTKIHLKTTKNPHSVLDLLRSYNFAAPDIAKLVARLPKILLSDPNKTLKPKLDFFQSVGFSGPALISLVTSVPVLLQFSLENKLARNFDILKNILRTDANAVSAIKCTASLLGSDLDQILLSEIKALQDYGVPTNVMLKLLTLHCNFWVVWPNRFEEIFDRMKRIGISPTSLIFAHAFRVLGKLPGRVWERKVDNFKKLGWSEEQVVLAFAKHPYCMTVSSEKIAKNMEFFKEKFGWDPEYVARRPVVFSYNFEKRVVPRYRVLAILEAKGLFSGRVRARQLMLGEKEFLTKYVVKYYEQAPELVDDVDVIRNKIANLGLLKGNNQPEFGIDTVNS